MICFSHLWAMKERSNVSMPPYASMNGGHYACARGLPATRRRRRQSGRLPSRNGQKWAKRVSRQRKERKKGKISGNNRRDGTSHFSRLFVVPPRRARVRSAHVALRAVQIGCNGHVIKTLLNQQHNSTNLIK